jgi:voltage-gated potassium channel
LAISWALRWLRLRRRTYAVLEAGASGDQLARTIHLSIVALIIISVITVILESVPSLDQRFGRFFFAIEVIAACIFTMEYILRLWAAVEHPPLKGITPWRARWLYAKTPAMLVDIIAILPFFLSLFAPDDVKVLLIFRLIRFFKLARYSPGMRSLQEAVVQEQRALLACLVILCGLMIVAAATMHMVEAAAQPDKFGSIPESMWWAIITLTTVGYGDAVPITPMGKVVAGITALGGLVMLALPVGIIATSFADVIRRREFVVTWGMISSLPIFANMEAHVVGEVLRVMRSQMAEPGDIIIRKGDRADRMYLVASGSVEELLPEGRVLLTEGDFFGDDTVLTGEPRRASVRAVERTRLLALERADIHHLIEHEPRLNDEFIAITERRRNARQTPP